MNRHRGRIGLLAALAVLSAGTLQAAEDGRRAVDVRRYGVHTRAPQAWRLIEWGRDEYAFILRLPQDSGSAEGYVRCELSLAPESLDEHRRRLDENARADDQKQPTAAPTAKTDPAPAERGDVVAGRPRKLLENRLEEIHSERWGESLARQAPEMLTTVWEITGEGNRRWYEVRSRLIVGETMYTFILTTDEAHFLAYRADFDEMLAACRFEPPETGVQRMPGGYWMQRDFHFAMQLPGGWKPSFGPNDKVLFFAIGDSHDSFTNNLIVLATPPRPLDLETLKMSLPAEIARQDKAAEVTCRILPQGKSTALETVVRTQRGPFKITILERRFRGELRNYEIKFTCDSADFDKAEAELRRALDTFVEVKDVPRSTDT